MLSDRREHLVKMRDMFLGEWGDRQKVKIGFYVGGMDREALDYARTCDLLFGTAQYCREALDDPGLDSIFLTMPKGDVEQPIGRILRKVEGKKEPLVVDFVDEKIWVCKEFAQKRQNLYKRLGFEVVHIE